MRIFTMLDGMGITTEDDLKFLLEFMDYRVISYPTTVPMVKHGKLGTIS